MTQEQIAAEQVKMATDFLGHVNGAFQGAPDSLHKAALYQWPTLPHWIDSVARWAKTLNEASIQLDQAKKEHRRLSQGA